MFSNEYTRTESVCLQAEFSRTLNSFQSGKTNTHSAETMQHKYIYIQVKSAQGKIYVKMGINSLSPLHLPHIGCSISLRDLLLNQQNK